MRIRPLVIPVGHAAVIYRDGRRLGVHPAGRVRLGRRQRVHLVDLRERQHVLAPQDIPTTEGLGVRVTAVARWAVIEPAAWLEQAQSPLEVLHVAVQVALRDAVAALSAEQVVSAMRELDVTAAVDAQTRPVGVQTLAVTVRDVVLPADLRAAAAALATARLRGAAQVEAARAETASLRTLANGARLLEEHPALARLRVVQAAPIGAKVVLHLDGPGDRTSGHVPQE